MAATDLLEDWLATEGPRYKSKEIWSAALRAVEKLPADVEPALRDRVFDRLLDEEPDALYRAIPKLGEAHRPAVLEALGRCEDPEAKLLLAAADAFDDAAGFVKAIAGTSNCPLVVKKVVASPDAKKKSVVEACLAVVKGGYPRDGIVSFCALVSTVFLNGSPAQIAALSKLRPPDHAIGWLRTVAKKLPAAKAGPVKTLIEGREEEPFEVRDRETRYRPLKKAAPPAKPAKPSKAASPKDRAALLAAVYAAPADDAPRAVYADWLLEQGDPLGELIQLQLSRAAGKRGTLSKEKILVEKHGAKLWPDHPSAIADAIRFERIERGFPFAFAVSDPSAEVRKKLEKNPGWATVREIQVWNWSHPSLGKILWNPMPSLRKLSGIDFPVLALIAGSTLAIEELGIYARSLDGRAPKVPGLPALTTLELERAVRDAPIEAGLERLRETGLESRLRSLTLRGFSPAAPVATALSTLRALPETLGSLTLDWYYDNFARAVRDGTKTKIETSVAAAQLDDVLAELAALPAKELSEVHVILSPSGFFVNKERPAIAERVKKALSKLPGLRVTADPKRT